MLEATSDLEPRKERTVIREETQSLKVGYTALLMERYPFTKEYSDCRRPEEAYFLYLEKTFTDIPLDLRYDALEPAIAKSHKQRMSDIYQFLLKQRLAYIQSIEKLASKWRKPPWFYRDKKANRIIKESEMEFQERYRKAIKAIISTSKRTKQWREDEKDSRIAFEPAQKKFLTTLRLYYEMLLERQEDSGESVLPTNHPLRQRIAEHNRVLRLLESTYACLGFAKHAHHEQPGDKFRETEKVPYITHPAEVSGATDLDVIPFVIGEQKMRINMTLLGIIPPTHDVLEDTGVSENGIVKILKKRLDDHEKLRSAIKSGFGKECEDVEKEVLDLLKEDDETILRQIIRILSKNYKLTDKEKKRGMRANTAGPELTQELLEVSDKEITTLGLKDPIRRQKTAKTFQLTPKTEDYEKKMATFLVRMRAITAWPTVQQYALIVKCEDQAHNLMHMDSKKDSKNNGKTAEGKRIVLRRNMLLARWCMNDHDNKKYPLYNALPRLIETMLIEYEKLKMEECLVIEDGLNITELQQYIKQLQERGQIYELPREIQDIINQQRKAHRNIVHPLDGTGLSRSYAEGDETPTLLADAKARMFSI